VNHAAPGTSILIAEDEPVLLRLIERVLSRAGYKVLTAADGDAALKCVGEHAGEIHTAIIDGLITPRGAAEIIKAIVEQSAGTSLILTSGDNLDKSLKQLMVEHSAVFLRKPFAPEALLRALEESATREVE